jgi:tRNA dimethylallyltransferase
MGLTPPQKALICLAGPTASGKSALALALAQRRLCFSGAEGSRPEYKIELVNADSCQIYADLPILTARPTPDERSQAPHHLDGILEATQHCSAARWRDLAVSTLEAIWQRGAIPLVVGGTGLYLRTLLEGIAPVPDIPREVQIQIRDFIDTHGIQASHARLTLQDPKMAARLNPMDRQRITRALEVLAATGKSLLHFQSLKSQGLRSDTKITPLVCIALLPERKALYARSDARLVRMLEAGALQEVRAFHARSLPKPLAIEKALGYAELLEVLDGSASLAEALAKAQQSTRHYIKRQYTWIRHQFADWAMIDALETAQAFQQLAIILRNNGLTVQ